MGRKLGLHGAVIPQADLITGLKAAAQAGFSAYEPEVSRLIETLDLVQTAGGQLVLDTFHFVVCGASQEQIARIPKELIGVVHISDAQTEGQSLVELTDAERVLPGEGGFSLVEVLDAVRQTGYQGGLSVEVFHPKYRQRDPFQVAVEACERTSSVLKKSGWFKS